MQFLICISVYTLFPREVKRSVGTEQWLQAWVMRIVMSTKTRNITFDGQGTFNAISPTYDIFGVSNCIIHIEWMVMLEWMAYITANWSNYPIIMRNVHVLKNESPTFNQWN